MLKVSEERLLNHVADVQNYASVNATERDGGNTLAWVVGGGKCIGEVVAEIRGYNEVSKTYYINTNIYQ